jgi:hypothetical protein
VAAVFEEPLSPELVLVSPPEIAQRARELLADPFPVALAEVVPSHLGPLLFALACAANCIVPTTLLLLR